MSLFTGLNHCIDCAEVHVLVDGGNGLVSLVPLVRGQSVSDCVSNDAVDCLFFESAANTSYAIQVDDGDSGGGPFQLAIVREPRPANDDFTHRIVLAGVASTVTGTTFGATAEPGEPGSIPGSVWYSYIAPAAGTLSLTLTPSSSNFYPVVAAYLTPANATLASVFLYT